jgi:hypothetical protein
MTQEPRGSRKTVTVSALFWKSIQWRLYKNLTKTAHPGVDWVEGKFTGILACWDNKP